MNPLECVKEGSVIGGILFVTPKIPPLSIEGARGAEGWVRISPTDGTIDGGGGDRAIAKRACVWQLH